MTRSPLDGQQEAIKSPVENQERLLHLFTAPLQQQVYAKPPDPTTAGLRLFRKALADFCSVWPPPSTRHSIRKKSSNPLSSAADRAVLNPLSSARRARHRWQKAAGEGCVSLEKLANAPLVWGEGFSFSSDRNQVFCRRQLHTSVYISVHSSHRDRKHHHIIQGFVSHLTLNHHRTV